MRDGRTRFAYKAERAVDLRSDLLVAAGICRADEPGSETALGTVTSARKELEAADSEHAVAERDGRGCAAWRTWPGGSGGPREG